MAEDMVYFEGMEGKRWLVTGGTGSLGSHLVPYILDNLNPISVTVFSRNEYEQYQMRSSVPDAEYIIGDVRDESAVWALRRYAFDYIVHAAALKHVRTAEEQPQEAYKTNVVGTENIAKLVIGATARMVLVSTDKAVEPVNAYGATKMLAERIAIDAGQQVVRYGNVFGSRGSVLHCFADAAANGSSFRIHDKRMTRFVITFNQAIAAILQTLALRKYDQQLFVPTLPAMRITDLARAFDDNAEFEEIGVQPGEKLHEKLRDGLTSDSAPKLSVEEIRRLINATI